MPQTRAVRPRWMLEELQLPYTLRHIDLFSGEGETDEYKKINPYGAIPSMIIDDQVMHESAAMCHWLADMDPDKGLAPAITDPDRMKYEQWMYYSQATLEPQPWLVIMHSYVLPEEQRVDDIIPWAKQRSEKILAVLNEELKHGGYLLGEKFSAADIMVGSTLMMMKDELSQFSALKKYVEKLQQRPAYQAASS